MAHFDPTSMPLVDEPLTAAPEKKHVVKASVAS
jgi:hypothetical protein